MLNKDICKRCINKHCNAANGWNAQDETHWQSEFVICPPSVKRANAATTEKPPEHCPYVTEHAVSQNAE